MARPFLRGCWWGFVSGCVTGCAAPLVVAAGLAIGSVMLGVAIVQAVAEALADPQVQASLDQAVAELESAPPQSLDTIVLGACGPWGGDIGADEAADILGQWTSEHIPGTLDLKRIHSQWTVDGGMTHIFCGQPSRSGIGGMHYEARVRQALGERWVARHPLCEERQRGDLVVQGYLTTVDHILVPSCPKSYVRGLDASAILALTTLAAHSIHDGQCLVDIPGKGIRWKVTMRGGNIHTAWPVVSDPGTPPCQFQAY